MNSAPRVGMGLPVYNGQKHLALTLDSLLAQTYGDFELIISDNASTDATEEICRAYAARDKRVRYYRNPENLGASRNYNRVFELSSGSEYFRWNAHDDLIAPTYLEKNVKALDDAPPSVVMTVPHRRYITWEEGNIVGSAYESVAGVSTEAGLANTVRIDSFANLSFSDLLHMAGSWFQMLAFALCRSEALRKTHLLGAFPGADLVMIMELRILGEFVEVPEDLYFQRLHPASGWTGRKNRKEETAWFDPKRKEPLLPHRMHLYKEYFRAIHRSPVSQSVKMARYMDLFKRIAEGAVKRPGRFVGAKKPAL